MVQTKGLCLAVVVPIGEIVLIRVSAGKTHRAASAQISLADLQRKSQQTQRNSIGDDEGCCLKCNLYNYAMIYGINHVCRVHSIGGVGGDNHDHR